MYFFRLNIFSISYHRAHRAHRGFSNFSVPSVRSVGTIYPAREDGGSYHRVPRAPRDFYHSLCPLCALWEQYTLHGRIIPQSTQSTQRFLPFSVPAVRSVVTIHPTREDHTTEHTEVAPFLCALCALCGNNIPSTGGSYHGAHRGFSNFSVPAVLSVVSLGLIRLDH